MLNSIISPTHPYEPPRTILTHIASSTNHGATADRNPPPPSSLSPPTPMLLHCTAGKDRTGILTAILLSLLGVPDDVVADEYALTDLGLHDKKQELVSRLTSEHSPFGMDRAGAERMVGAPREKMLGVLAFVRERWAGVEAMLRDETGIGPELVQRVRQAMLVEA